MQRSQRSTGDKDRTPALIVLPVAFGSTDSALVAALREGRPGAKAELFNRYSGQVERIITHVIGPDRELADLIQETFARVLSSLSKLEEPSALRAWIFRIATLTARKLLRTRSRRAWLRSFVDASEEAQYEPVIAATDLEAVRSLRAVYATLSRLPDDERVAFTLRFIEGMELSEVAAACAVSLATIKRRLQRSEQRFVLLAQKDPALSDWLERGSRWQNR